MVHSCRIETSFGWLLVGQLGLSSERVRSPSLPHCFIGGAAEAAEEHESTLEIWDQMDGEGREEAAANE